MRPKLYFLGDSHVTCVVQGLSEMPTEHLPIDIFASRFSAKRAGEGIIERKQALDILSRASEHDTLVLMMNGNYFNILGLMQHPQPFNTFEGNDGPAPGETLIPARVLEAVFADHVSRDTFLPAARKVFNGTIFLMIAPPPKLDAEYIKAKAERHYKAAGIGDLGVSPANLRIKLWRMQERALQRFGAPHNASILEPPRAGVDSQGFLKEEFYYDATHANPAYGRLIVEHVVELVTKKTLEQPSRRTTVH